MVPRRGMYVVYFHFQQWSLRPNSPFEPHFMAERHGAVNQVTLHNKRKLKPSQQLLIVTITITCGICTCCWGSMMRGHRLQLVMIDPFSREILSAGSPSLVILALFPSFVRRSRGSTPGVNGILRSSISGLRQGHSWVCSYGQLTRGGTAGGLA